MACADCRTAAIVYRVNFGSNIIETGTQAGVVLRGEFWRGDILDANEILLVGMRRSL